MKSKQLINTAWRKLSHTCKPHTEKLSVTSRDWTNVFFAVRLEHSPTKQKGCWDTCIYSHNSSFFFSFFSYFYLLGICHWYNSLELCLLHLWFFCPVRWCCCLYIYRFFFSIDFFSEIKPRSIFLSHPSAFAWHVPGQGLHFNPIQLYLYSTFKKHSWLNVLNTANIDK